MRSEDDVIDLNPAHSGPLAEVAQDRNFVGQEVNLEGVGGQTAGLGAVTARSLYQPRAAAPEEVDHSRIAGGGLLPCGHLHLEIIAMLVMFTVFGPGFVVIVVIV